MPPDYSVLHPRDSEIFKQLSIAQEPVRQAAGVTGAMPTIPYHVAADPEPRPNRVE